MLSVIGDTIASELILCADTSELYVSNGPDKEPTLIGVVPYQTFALVHRV